MEGREDSKNGVCVCVCVCVCVHAKSFSHVRLFTTLWTIACQAPLSKGFSRQEYWSGFPFPSTGDLPNPRTERLSLKYPGLADGFCSNCRTIAFILHASKVMLKILQPRLQQYMNQELSDVQA